MQIIRSVKKMQELARELSRRKTIGFVPTMGFLHDGHLSLIKKAKAQSDIVVVSIFINPLQFAPHEDLAKYPRDEKGDIAKIKKAGGDIVFIPNREELYNSDFQTYVEVESITNTLEGKSRAGHFKGVTTVVAKLFNIVRPDVAVFGQKDYQQAMVIKRMVKDLDFPLKLITAPTVREKSGLAMSSRNKYFTPEQKKEAVCLYAALVTARNMVRKERVYDPQKLIAEMRRVIGEICPSAEIDYIAFTDFESLRLVKKVGKNTICSMAVRVQGVRLIDNMMMG